MPTFGVFENCNQQIITQLSIRFHILKLNLVLEEVLAQGSLQFVPPPLGGLLPPVRWKIYLFSICFLLLLLRPFYEVIPLLRLCQISGFCVILSHIFIGLGMLLSTDPFVLDILPTYWGYFILFYINISISYINKKVLQFFIQYI